VTLAYGPASAQDVRDADAKSYPNRTVRIIVPFPPGGPADIVARFVGQKMSEDWGQPVVIDAPKSRVAKSFYDMARSLDAVVGSIR
jgi:tripartite-type tricarboxylate transporter receptor subunit TctC